MGGPIDTGDLPPIYMLQGRGLNRFFFVALLHPVPKVRRSLSGPSNQVGRRLRRKAAPAIACLVLVLCGPSSCAGCGRAHERVRPGAGVPALGLYRALRNAACRRRDAGLSACRMEVFGNQWFWGPCLPPQGASI